MSQPRIKVCCEACGRWTPVEEEGTMVECGCGRRFVVTVTALGATSV